MARYKVTLQVMDVGPTRIVISIFFTTFHETFEELFKKTSLIALIRVDVTVKQIDDN